MIPGNTVSVKQPRSPPAHWLLLLGQKPRTTAVQDASRIRMRLEKRGLVWDGVKLCNLSNGMLK
jgi:hypothetical protein